MELEQSSLFNELNHGRELTKQLMNHLTAPSSSESREFLIDRILCSYENALSLLNWDSIAKSTCVTDVHRHDFKNPKTKNVLKRRKTEQQWSEQVKVVSGSAFEGPLDDGFTWRKYGQKDILGATFPRGYFRCTLRHTKGCLATKQVQRSNEDSTIFEVTYKGRHTCNQHSSNLSSLPPASPVAKLDKDQRRPQTEGQPKQVKTEDLDITDNCNDNDKKEDSNIFPCFAFPLNTTTESENEENSLLGYFMSPTTSDSNLFGAGWNGHTSESELTDVNISAPASASNSPLGELELDVIDTNLSFDYCPDSLFEAYIN